MNSIKNLREFICLNQKELIKYEYIVSQNHKNLRKYLEREIIDKEKLDQLIQKLINVAYQDLIRILKKNTVLINQLFKSIGISKNPRINIKTLEDGSVLDLFRSHTKASLKTSEIDSNTGFSEIMSSSKIMSFLRNDLEQDFINDKYKNPRLDESLREKLENGSISWEKCWKPIIHDNTEKTYCYRSTLIIPMAIRISESDNKLFINKFSTESTNSENIRTIWGFLCFDYEDKNIFLDKEDELKDIGYIIADILSLYLMFFYDHISGSDTFNKALLKL
jgi:hypothetical protein